MADFKTLIETLDDIECMSKDWFSPIAIVSTTTGIRPMVTNYKEGLGLYWVTRAGSDKLEQLKADKRAVAFFGKMQTHKYCEAVFDIEASTDAAVKAEAWNDGFKQVGYTGPDDENMVILKATPVSANVMDMATFQKERHTY